MCSLGAGSTARCVCSLGADLRGRQWVQASPKQTESGELSVEFLLRHAIAILVDAYIMRFFENMVQILLTNQVFSIVISSKRQQSVSQHQSLLGNLYLKNYTPQPGLWHVACVIICAIICVDGTPACES